MKLPSLSHIYSDAKKTLVRFPFTLASAATASLAAVFLIGLDYGEAREWDFLYKVIITAVLGIPLFMSLSVMAQRKGESAGLNIMAGGFGLALLVIYYFFLPGDINDAPSKHIVRYVLFFIGIHLWVAVAPFIGRGEINGFWQYNKTLFLRFLTAVLFAGVLYAGLSIALLSLDNLLGITIDGDRYAQLLFLITGLFNTWFFLSGVPENLDELEQEKDYPRGLMVFTQYILIPLVIVYLLILYVYAGKIIVNGSWPEGWVANLILSFSIAGILSLLLLYPIRENIENTWIKTFSKRFYLALVPLVIMLFLAIWRRISEYSFTENRYFVMALALWLAGIVGYFIISKVKNIKVIPSSLCIIAFLISVGPWGAFSVSKRSQVSRLRESLQKNDILVDGSIRKAPDPVTFEDRKEISNIMRYIIDTHGSAIVQPWFDQDLSELKVQVPGSDSTRTLSRSEIPQKMVDVMGIEYVNEWESPDTLSPYKELSATREATTSIERFDWLVQEFYLNEGDTSKSLTVDEKEFIIGISPDSLNIYIRPSEREMDTDTGTGMLILPIDELLERLSQAYPSQNHNIPPEELSLEASSDSFAAKVYLRHISWNEKDEGKRKLQNARMDLLLTFSPE